jgi:NAD-specific glutamate dehydrogenase
LRHVVDHALSAQPADAAKSDSDQLSEMVKAGLPPTVAREIVKAQYLGVALMVQSEAQRMGLAASDMMVRHLAIARASRLHEVLEEIAKRPATGRWDPIALQIFHHRFLQLLRNLVVRVPIDTPSSSVDELALQLSTGPLAEVRARVGEMLGGDALAVATLVVLEERISAIIARLPETGRAAA